MIIPLLIQSLSLLSLHLEILNVFRVSRNKKSVLNELMNFSVVEWEFSINLNSSPRINSHFSFLDTDSFKHFQFQKTHGTVILHFGDDVILHFEKGNDFFKWSFIFFRLNAFPWILLLWPNQIFRNNAFTWYGILLVLSKASNIYLLFIQVKTRCPQKNTVSVNAL